MKFKENIHQLKTIFTHAKILQKDCINSIISPDYLEQATATLKNYTNCAPLIHYLAATRSIKALKTIIIQGADVNALDDEGYTPAHYAAFFGFESVLELLKENGANLTILSSNKQTVIHCAAASSFNTIHTFAFLLHQRIDPFQKDDSDQTALHYANTIQTFFNLCFEIEKNNYKKYQSPPPTMIYRQFLEGFCSDFLMFQLINKQPQTKKSLMNSSEFELDVKTNGTQEAITTLINQQELSKKIKSMTISFLQSFNDIGSLDELSVDHTNTGFR